MACMWSEPRSCVARAPSGSWQPPPSAATSARSARSEAAASASSSAWTASNVFRSRSRISDGDDALAGGRDAVGRGQQRRYPRLEAEALQSRRGEHDRAEPLVVQLSQARVDVAAHGHEPGSRQEHRELGDAADAARADRRRGAQRRNCGRRLRERRRARQHERVARIFARQHRRHPQARRKLRRHVLRRVDRQIDPLGQERLFDFLDEEPLAARVGERLVLDSIARRLDDDELGSAAPPFEQGRDGPRLPERQLAASRADAQRGRHDARSFPGRVLTGRSTAGCPSSARLKSRLTASA